jgi:hypothetical protein
MPRKNAFALVLIVLCLSLLGLVMAQAGGGGNRNNVDCSPDGLASHYADLAEDYPLEGDDAAANAFALGAALQDLSLSCGYEPAQEEVDAQIDRTLSLAPLSLVIEASSIGGDVDQALAAIEDLSGDSFNGQLLFNGIEMGLDGAELGCAGCHDGEEAPAAEGTWTRADEIRLLEAQFADYTVTQYLVESILQPQAYIVPEYEDVLMPNNFHLRLDAQQLADLVAYLESQDQE